MEQNHIGLLHMIVLYSNQILNRMFSLAGGFISFLVRWDQVGVNLGSYFKEHLTPILNVLDIRILGSMMINVYESFRVP